MCYICELKERECQPALVMRTRTRVQDLPVFLGRAFGAIAAHLGQLDQQPAGPPFAVYHNMEMHDLDVEAGFPVAHHLVGAGGIRPGEIPGGRVVCCLHVGPYSEVEPAYRALFEFIQANGYTPTGLAYEFYLNDPQQTPPEELRTEIVLPLR